MKPHHRRIKIPVDGFSEPMREWYRSGYHVMVDDRRVFVYDRGTGPVVLLLHGFPTSCYDWRAVMQRLALNGRRVAFDFLGFGLSDKPEAFSYSLFQQADLVEGLMRELGIESAHVVSHDMGTSVHCELLARQNAGQLGFRIRSSSLLNGSMLQWMAHLTPFQELLAHNDRLEEAMAICGGEFDSIYVPALRAIMQKPQAITDEDAVVMNELMRYQDGAKRIPAIGGYMRERYLHRERWLGALERTDAPLQFIWADGDPIAHAGMGRRLHELYPRARYAEVVGAGHFLLLEDPEAVAAEIQALIGPGGQAASPTAAAAPAQPQPGEQASGVQGLPVQQQPTGQQSIQRPPSEQQPPTPSQPGEQQPKAAQLADETAAAQDAIDKQPSGNGHPQEESSPARAVDAADSRQS